MHSVLSLNAVLTPCCNLVPNELNSLVILDGDQLAHRVLGLSAMIIAPFPHQHLAPPCHSTSCR